MNTPELTAEHTSTAIVARLRHGPPQSGLRDFVYGAIDGTITTFAVVAGVAGAGLRPVIAMVLGLANLVADGFSMATANFLGTRAEQQRRDQIRAEERRHVRLVPAGEREELRQLLAARGFDGPALDQAVESIARHPDLWVDLMLEWEHGFPVESPRPLRAAGITFVAFIAVGAVPLLGLALAELPSGGSPFVWSATLTLVAFVLVGTLKGLAVDRPPWRSALEAALVGGFAAGLAFAVGTALGGFT